MGLTCQQFSQSNLLKGQTLPWLGIQPDWERRGLKTSGTYPAGKHVACGTWHVRTISVQPLEPCAKCTQVHMGWSQLTQPHLTGCAQPREMPRKCGQAQRTNVMFGRNCRQSWSKQATHDVLTAQGARAHGLWLELSMSSVCPAESGL